MSAPAAGPEPPEPAGPVKPTAADYLVNAVGLAIVLVAALALVVWPLIVWPFSHPLGAYPSALPPTRFPNQELPVDAYMVTLRLVHIVSGVFWAGTLWFAASYLEPSIRETGPEGGKVMQALLRRGYLNTMPAVALVAILSGFLLMWRVSDGFSSAWMGTPYGRALSLGALAALVAFALGVFVMRPTVLRMGALAQAAAQATDDAARQATLAEVELLRQRARAAGRAVAGLLGVAVVMMAVAQYL